MNQLLLLSFLALLLLGYASAETFHFEIDPDTIDCDDPTIYETHLKTFNLMCIDGLGCERGGGIIGAGAHVAEHSIPTTVHILVHGCHFFDQYCPEDEFNGFIDVCDSVSGLVAEQETFCSGFEKEGRFALGIPVPTQIPGIGTIGIPGVDIEDVVVEFTFDELSFCSAKFHVTIGEGLVAGLLGFGAPLVGIGVSFLLGASLISKYLKSKANQTPIALQVEEEPEVPPLEPMRIPKGVKTTPIISAIRGQQPDDDERPSSYKLMLDFKSPNGISHAGQMEMVRQAHFERLRATRQARRADGVAPAGGSGGCKVLLS